MNQKKLYIAGAGMLLAIVVGVIFFVHRTPATQITQKCPDDYANDAAGDEEYTAAIDKWINDFYDTHPGATFGDWLTARRAFWVENNCIAALRRYAESKAGKANPATMEQINNGIQDAINDQPRSQSKWRWENPYAPPRRIIHPYR